MQDSQPHDRGEAGLHQPPSEAGVPMALQLQSTEYTLTPGSRRYHMNYKSRGVAVIINNVDFHASLNLSERKGSDDDATSLHNCFIALGFTQITFRKNLSCDKIRRLLEDAAKRKHEDHAMFICAILSHGEQGQIYGTDGLMPLQDVFDCVKIGNNYGLAGKPKFFIIKACRGPKLDPGVEVRIRTDGPCLSRAVDVVDSYVVPADADFLYAYSTVPGFMSFRRENGGSFFIRALTEELQRPGEILSILTRVNRRVAFEFQANNRDDAAIHQKKQMPCIVTMLTKELYLT